MADYKSSYTGEKIDAILNSISFLVDIPDTQGVHFLQCIVTDGGNVTYEWMDSPINNGTYKLQCVRTSSGTNFQWVLDE